MGRGHKDSQSSSSREPRERGSLLVRKAFNGLPHSPPTLAQQHLKNTTKHLSQGSQLALKDCPVGFSIVIKTVGTQELPGNCRFSHNEVTILAKPN